MNGTQAYVLARKYTDDTASQFGALKGASCQIQNVEYDTDDNTVITFKWENTAGQVQTTQVTVKRGANELTELKDIDIDNLQVGDILVYDDSVNAWVNKSMPIIPSKVSDLTNDSNFQTNYQVAQSISDATQDLAKKTVVDGLVDFCQISEDTQNALIQKDGKLFVAKSSGTGYDDTEVRELIQDNADAISTLGDSVQDNADAIDTLNGTGEGSVSKKIADEIGKLAYLEKYIATQSEIDGYIADPTTAKFNTIYLLKVESATGDDKYKEYQRLGNETTSTFECTGDTSTDLSNVINKTQGIANAGKALVVGADGDIALDNTTYTKTSDFNQLAEKVADIELFKFPNAVIHGEPTINNGQISGFSNTNYLVFPSVFDLSGRGFEFKFAFTTKDDVTTPQNILGGKYCMALFVQNGKLNLRVSFNGSSWDIVNLEGTATIEANKTYYVKINFTRLNYVLSLSTDDETYNEIGSVSTGDISPYPSEIYIGVGNNFNNPFKGIINLNKCYLKVNQSVIWQGMDDAGLSTRLATDLDNIDEAGVAKIKEIVGTNYVNKTDIVKAFNTITTDTNIPSEKLVKDSLDAIEDKVDELQLYKFPNAIIIGDPTINNGQISNLSNSDYLKFPFLVDFNNKPFEINMAFTTGTNVTSQENIFDSDFGLAFAIRNGHFIIAISSNGTSWNIGEGVGTHTIEPNTAYRVKFAWNGSQYTLDYSINGGESYTRDITKAGTTQPYPKQIFIGVGQSDSSVLNHFTGIINMNRAELSIDGTVRWQGMDDVGLATRLATDVSNIDEAGVVKIKEIVGKTDTSKVEKVIADNWNSNGCNLIPFPYYDGTNKSKDGITYTAFESGEVLAVGIGTSNLAYYITQAYNFTAGTYRLSGCPKGGSDTTYYQYVQNADSAFSMIAKDVGEGATFTLDTDTRLRVGLYVIAGYDANITFKPMLVKVNEDGSYPTEYQRFASGNVELTDEISQTELEIVELKMLGWTVPKECEIQNEVNGSYFTQKVGRVDLGTLDWAWSTELNWYYFKYTDAKAFNNDTVFNGYLDGYDNYSRNGMSVTEVLKGIAINTTSTICVKDSNYTDVDSFKSAMSGKYLYFELIDDKKITKTIDGNEVISKVNNDLHDLSFGELSGSKNIFKVQLINTWQCNCVIDSNDKITLTSTGTSGVAYARVGTLDLKANTEYTFNILKESGDLANIQLYKDNSIYVTNLGASTNTFTPTEDMNVTVLVYVTIGSGKTCNLKLMVSTDGVHTTYEPYIQSVKMLTEETEQINNDLHNLSYNEIAGGKNLANDILFDESKYILRDTTWSYIDVSSLFARKKFTASMKDNPNLSELNCGFGTDSTVDPVVANRFVTSGTIKSVTYDFSTSDKVYLFVATAGGYISTKLNKMLNALSTRLQVEIGDTATDYAQPIKSNAILTTEIAQKELELAELKMLGWTVPKECLVQNTVSGNTFIQRVGRVDLGALNWGINAYATPTAFSLHENIDLPDLVSVSDNKDEKVRCYSPNYASDSASKVTGTTRTYTFCVITGKRLYVRADVTTAEELKAELKDKYIYYELENPITKQIDSGEIVENLTDQGLINKAVWHQGSINYSSGAIVTSTTAIYSDEIPCKQGDLISVANMENSGENIVMVYYNASGYVGKDTSKLQFTVPANATKFRANYRKASTPNSNAKVFVNNAISKIGFTRTVVKDYEITVSANSVGQINLDSSQTNNLFAVANIPYNGTDGFANVEPALIYVRNVTNQERLFKIRVIAFF